MFTECKITEIFFMADEFCKFFDSTVKKYSVEDKGRAPRRPYHRASTLSNSEVMVIMILFHNSGYRCLKHFYLEYVCKHLRHLFPKELSYNRFVELEKNVGCAQQARFLSQPISDKIIILRPKKLYSVFCIQIIDVPKKTK